MRYGNIKKIGIIGKSSPNPREGVISFYVDGISSSFVDLPHILQMGTPSDFIQFYCVVTYFATGAP